jgi:hydroxycarboxylate dehydrogenase B
MPVFGIDELESSCARVFEGAGLDADEAKMIAHSLVLANVMGHDSHGVIRVVQYCKALDDGKVKPGQKIKVTKEADASAVVDGEWGFGQPICYQAMDLAIEKAKARSVAVVEVFNCSHIGRLGEYVEYTAEQGILGIVMCNNHGGGLLQPPFGGIDARMSPNPIAVGIPTGGDFPVIVDMTSSVVAEGKIRVKRNRGETLPEGWVVDGDGKPTTDPAKFYGPPRGAILPFGGISAHKGYALSIVVDVLSGALGGSGLSRDGGQSGGNGVFVMAIDIEAFIGKDDFEKDMQTFIRWLKSSRMMEGFEEILLPGEMESRQRKAKESEGVFVDDETWRQIGETGGQYGVSL